MMAPVCVVKFFNDPFFLIKENLLPAEALENKILLQKRIF